GADLLVSVDDDNLPLAGQPFLPRHAIVCEDGGPATVLESESGWFNLVGLLKTVPPIEVYPRGFPYGHRFEKAFTRTELMDEGRVRLNAGLWVGDPDVDSITRLTHPIRTLDAQSEDVVLGPHAWSPINTQNTALN